MPEDDEETAWHRKRIAENTSVLVELEAGNGDGGEVFPETQAEVQRLKAQIEQSRLIVAAYEKRLGVQDPNENES
jgi:hypothetical protein